MAKRKNSGDVRRIDQPEPAGKAEDSALADTATVSVEDSVFIDLGRHRVEYAVQKHLLSQPDLHFTSLVVRRTPNGICLEGAVETTADAPDVCNLARSVAGVGEVINRLMVRRHSTIAKG